jgi:hypothetical protein
MLVTFIKWKKVQKTSIKVHYCGLKRLFMHKLIASELDFEISLLHDY